MSERLKLFERIADGGTAEIFRGAICGERGTRRIVAIKKLRPELREVPAAVELFVHEAQIALALAHPHVLHAIELVRDEGGYALVYEWLDAASLEEIRDRLDFLPWPCAVYLGRALCSALVYLHAAPGVDGTPLGIVHCDVTPANVLVSAQGLVKLGDFGIARSPHRPNGAAGGGTLGFAAPEQAGNGVVDARTDVFGLGATLRAVVAEPPLALAAALARACASEPGERFSDAVTFDAALAAVAADAGLNLGPESLARWIAERGGLDWLPRPASLDGALHRLLAPALPAASAVGSPSPKAPLRIRSRTRRRTAVVGAASAAVVLVALGLSRARCEQRSIQPLSAASESAPPDTMSPQTATVAPPAPTKHLAERPESGTVRPSPPPPAIPVPSSRVSLNVKPWARVSVDDKFVGNTPLRLQLAAGAHRLRFEHPRLTRELVVTVEGTRDEALIFDLFAGTLERERR